MAAGASTEIKEWLENYMDTVNTDTDMSSKMLMENIMSGKAKTMPCPMTGVNVPNPDSRTIQTGITIGACSAQP